MPGKTTIPLTSDLVKSRLDGTAATIQGLRAQAGAIAAIGELIAGKLRAGETLYTCGNGGSAAQALHLAEELVGRYRGNRAPLPAVCLNADGTAMTCIANDFGYENVFARQCEALVRAGDVLLVFTTSGRSANIVNALRAASSSGAVTIGLLGQGGGECAALCDHRIIVEPPGGGDSAHIQEAHQVILHLICEFVEREFGR